MSAMGSSEGSNLSAEIGNDSVPADVVPPAAPATTSRIDSTGLMLYTACDGGFVKTWKVGEDEWEFREKADRRDPGPVCRDKLNYVERSVCETFATVKRCLLQLAVWSGRESCNDSEISHPSFGMSCSLLLRFLGRSSSCFPLLHGLVVAFQHNSRNVTCREAVEKEGGERFAEP